MNSKLLMSLFSIFFDLCAKSVWTKFCFYIKITFSVF